ncbi:chemotaxis protein CheX [Paraglaciecola polaris]|uniref:Chemotaxis protein CheX n=1 Tax=Paraglaciecola polaris LMG 21857 TaxID=1129793 RepID=K6ZFV5_9ALTE|nr:chemotaxis protein CheX [Paraglaciecola polaris]GAC34916.1 chemotaxis protein CheX [Paraglaciecola polaris LMG 21857]|tara:strand:+ start:8200 stop:8664 length:465 start_codon:yes stop_codon:yes gene_type:complete
MNAEFINPFIAALRNVLSTMAQIELVPGKPQKKTDTTAQGDVSGLIGMVGDDITGSLSITFETSVALKVMQNMLGEQLEKVNDDVADMVGEITNMICGGAKNELGKLGYNFGMATPVVVFGKDHTLSHTASGRKLIMPFASDHGKIFLEMCFDK